MPAIRLSVYPPIRPARSHQSAGASPSTRAQAPGGTNGHAAERARARRGGDAQGAGGGRPDRARRRGGARSGGSPGARDLHGDDAAAGGGAAWGAGHRGRGGVSGGTAQQRRELRRGHGIAARPETAARTSPRPAGGRRATAGVRRLGSGAPARVATGADRTAGRQSRGDGRDRVSGDRVRPRSTATAWPSSTGPRTVPTPPASSSRAT